MPFRGGLVRFIKPIPVRFTEITVGASPAVELPSIMPDAL